MELDQLNFEYLETQSLAKCFIWLVKYWEIENIEMRVEERDVRGGIWLTIAFTYERRDYGVSGSRIDIVKTRLFKLLRSLGVE